MGEHSLLPWAIMGTRGDIISDCKGFPQKPVAKVSGQETVEERAANTDLIVKAVNAWYDPAALRARLAELEGS